MTFLFAVIFHGNHLDATFVPLIGFGRGDNLEILLLGAGRHFQITHDKRLDLFDEAFLYIGRSKALDEVRLFDISGVIFTRLALVNNFNFVE